MTDEEFEQYVAEGIAALPEWAQKKIENVAFIIEETAPEAGLYGLYEGVPLAERGDDVPLLPDTITIYKNTILSAYSSPADIKECVLNTIWHEVAHYFGHDEDWVEREEKKRGKIK